MFLLYSFVLVIYNWLITVASLLGHNKAKKWVKGRKEQAGKLENIPRWDNYRKIWIHAASYGEYEMAKPIISVLLTNPRNRLYVSFFSPSGYENIHFEDERIFKIYLPLDLQKNQRELVSLLKPDKVVFIKYEFWFNLLAVLNQAHIPYFFTSIHLNQNHYLWRWGLSPFRDTLHKAARLYCHNPASMSIFKKQGFTNLRLFGDTRINKALENKAEPSIDLQWTESKPTIIYGSIIPEEYQLIDQCIKGFSDCNHILAPHDVAPQDLQKLNEVLSVPISHYNSYKQTGNDIPSTHCLVINTLGDLKYLYRNATVAYIGAGFEKGPHNVIEPMIYGVPTITGPNIEKFPMAGYLKNKELLEVISNFTELKSTLRRCLEDRSNRSARIVSELEQLKVDLSQLIQELEE